MIFAIFQYRYLVKYTNKAYDGFLSFNNEN